MKIYSEAKEIYYNIYMKRAKKLNDFYKIRFLTEEKFIVKFLIEENRMQYRNIHVDRFKKKLTIISAKNCSLKFSAKTIYGKTAFNKRVKSL